MKVANWERWQTYRKDRGSPPWIKIYRNLMSNPEWAILTDAEKGQLVSIWIVAADKKGLIPDSPRILRKICQLDEDPNISKFIDLGFLVTGGCQVDAKLTPSGCQLDPPETETETEEKPSSSGDEDEVKEEYYTTKKGRKLKNDKLRWFCHFWDAFEYKSGKAEAADSWLDIKNLTHDLAAVIYKAAQSEAKRRPGLKEKGSTPKMAQGWLTGKRWEDEPIDKSKKSEW